MAASPATEATASHGLDPDRIPSAMAVSQNAATTAAMKTSACVSRPMPSGAPTAYVRPAKTKGPELSKRPGVPGASHRPGACEWKARYHVP